MIDEDDKAMTDDDQSANKQHTDNENSGGRCTHNTATAIRNLVRNG